MAKHEKIKQIFADYARIANSAPFEEQKTWLLNTIESYSADYPDDFLGLCALYSQIGSLYRTYSKFDDSEAAFIKAQELLENNGDDKSYNYVTTLNNLAGLYMACKKNEKALELFDKSIEICSNGTSISLESYATALNNKGLILQEMGKYSDAEKQYRHALKIIEHIKDNGKLLATTYVNIAFVRYALGDKSEASDSMDKALDLFENGTLSKSLPMYKQCMLIKIRMIS